MNRSFVAILTMLCVGANTAHGMEGVFDREAEVQKYLLIIGSKTNGEVIDAAKAIYSSGISDGRLAKIVNDRLYNGYRDLAPPKSDTHLPPGAILAITGVDDEYGIAMCRALSSFGISEYASTLKQMGSSSKYGGVKSDKVRMVANAQIDRFEWHKRKNEIMASRQFHQPGDDQHASQILNLLMNDDVTYRNFALDRIFEEKLSDPRLYKTMEEQVTRYIDNRDSKSSRQDDNVIAKNIKLLGLSGDARYRAVLERVMTSHAASGVKKHAEVALNQLK